MSSAPSYMPPVEIGEVMRALAVGRVTQSRHWEYAEGDWVHGNFGVQEHAVSDGENVYKIHVDGPLTPQVYLGALGLTGLTAYFGIMHVGQVREAETVLVSGAAGGVGTAVGQIAKIQGAKAIGIAGGPEKCKLLVNELGFDGAVDYKRSDFREQLRDHTDKRVDIFFDNIGGSILNEGLTTLATHARVVICGAISHYNSVVPETGPTNYLTLLMTRSSMIGFVVADFASQFPEAMANISDWIRQGRFRSVEDTVPGGVSDFVSLLNRLFSGQNVGKLVLELRS